MHIENLKTNFTWRYVIAISLIAFLSSGAFYILYLALKVSDSTALIVNISGNSGCSPSVLPHSLNNIIFMLST